MDLYRCAFYVWIFTLLSVPSDSFNIDTRWPKIIRGSADAQFGYTVQQHEANGQKCSNSENLAGANQTKLDRVNLISESEAGPPKILRKHALSLVVGSMREISVKLKIKDESEARHLKAKFDTSVKGENPFGNPQEQQLRLKRLEVALQKQDLKREGEYSKNEPWTGETQGLMEALHNLEKAQPQDSCKGGLAMQAWRGGWLAMKKRIDSLGQELKKLETELQRRQRTPTSAERQLHLPPTKIYLGCTRLSHAN
ncbi:hypothetical protein scyTo_0013903 [Scyliorhinus torazame]|uniref:Centromere protein Cenp-F N-terminal domain-containing protein n=1 Tax=Scyliorhinus torazame TaxID=75743 RepID=A0A401P7A8_SCYTO|nr:hypothetical protein [Scyliorhinus torazame]